MKLTVFSGQPNITGLSCYFGHDEGVDPLVSFLPAPKFPSAISTARPKVVRSRSTSSSPGRIPKIETPRDLVDPIIKRWREFADRFRFFSKDERCSRALQERQRERVAADW